MSSEPSTGRVPSKKRWQFSIREMLLFTSVVAAVLCVAVQLPTVFRIVLVLSSIGCFLAAAMWTANFATSDKRPLLERFSWTVFGAFFLAYAALSCLATFVAAFAASDERPGALVLGPVLAGVTVVMGVCASVCFYRARRAVVRWRQMRRAASSSTRPIDER